LFEDFTINRQVVMLNAMFKDGGDFRKVITQMNDAYTTQNLSVLYQLMYEADYIDQEIKALPDNRNSNWIQQLPGIMQKNPAFVTVGALHLTGNSALIAELRKLGFTVTPVIMSKG